MQNCVCITLCLFLPPTPSPWLQSRQPQQQHQIQRKWCSPKFAVQFAGLLRPWHAVAVPAHLHSVTAVSHRRAGAGGLQRRTKRPLRPSMGGRTKEGLIPSCSSPPTVQAWIRWNCLPTGGMADTCQETVGFDQRVCWQKGWRISDKTRKQLGSS